MEKPFEGWDLRFTIEEAARAGTVVARLAGAVIERGSFRMGPLDLEIDWGDRVALTGANGTGKSTLVSALLGHLPLVAGDRWMGPSVVVGELGQDRRAMGGDLDLVRTVTERCGLTQAEARSLLAKFGLDAEHVTRPVARCPPGSGPGPSWPSSRGAGSTFWCWTSPPTISTCRPSSSWSRPWPGSAAPCCWSPTTASCSNRWTSPARSSSNYRTGQARGRRSIRPDEAGDAAMNSTVTDAWQTLVPPEGDRHGPLAPLLVVLTVGHRPGRRLQLSGPRARVRGQHDRQRGFLAFALTGAKGFSIGASLAALGAFAVGAVASGRMVTHLGPRRGRVLAVSTTCEAGLVAAALVVGWSASDLSAGVTRYVLIGLLGLSMGAQNGTARKLAVPDLTTTVLTQTITGAAFESRLGGGTNSRIGRRGLSAVAMFVGALVGAVCRPPSQQAPRSAVRPGAAGASGRGRRSALQSKPAWDGPT